jgi:hypothetical protein
MAVDLDKMLESCERGQWSVDDFDWTQTPIPLSREREEQICAHYVNMSYIERMAGALFLSLAARVDDPRLAAIFRSFHADELRHSHAAARLADYFDRHHYRVYAPNIPMLRFMPYFVSGIESLNPAFATSLILGGELILDMALLRGLNAYVADPLSQAVVEKINQDESRHLAMDVYMTEYFARLGCAAGDAQAFWLGRDFWGVLTWAPGFFGEVFFRPMQILDPTGEQMRAVIKRLRRFYDRPAVAGNPAVREFKSLVGFFESAVGAWIGAGIETVIRALSGVDLGFIRAASTASVYGRSGSAQLHLAAYGADADALAAGV